MRCKITHTFAICKSFQLFFSESAGSNRLRNIPVGKASTCQPRYRHGESHFLSQEQQSCPSVAVEAAHHYPATQKNRHCYRNRIYASLPKRETRFHAEKIIIHGISLQYVNAQRTLPDTQQIRHTPGILKPVVQQFAQKNRGHRTRQAQYETVEIYKCRIKIESKRRKRDKRGIGIIYRISIFPPDKQCNKHRQGNKKHLIQIIDQHGLILAE